MAIRHKRTTTSGYTWQSSDLVEGQIGLNLTDGTAHIKKADGSIVAIGGIENVVEDTTPQLGGDLDINGNKIVSTSNGNIAIEPNGTGIVTANKNIETTGDIKAKELHATNSSGDEGGQINLAQAATNSTLGGDTVTVDIWQNRFRIFEQGGDARGVYIDLTAAAAGVGTNLLSGGGGISDIVEDTTPQLGGDLDTNNHDITAPINSDLNIVSQGTGNINLAPDTGSVIIDGNEFPQTQGTAGEVLTADGSGLVEWKLPQTISVQVYNADSVTINKGEPVYVFSSTGTNISVKRALNTGDATSAQTLGLANESIATGATGIVICQGLLKNVDTSAYTAGQGLYLGSTAGSITTTKPYAPNHLVYLGFVETVNASSGRIYVRTQNGYELDEIHDADIGHTQALAANQYLRYTGSLWQNSALDISHDTAPNLGGNLDVSGYSIVSSSNGNITIAPNGTGDVILSTDTVTVGDSGAAGTVSSRDGYNLLLTSPNTAGGAASITLKGGDFISAYPVVEFDRTIKVPSTGYIAGTSAVTALTLAGYYDTAAGGPSGGQIAIGAAANSSIALSPDGTGDVLLNADTVRIGDNNANATLTTYGTGDLILNTNNGTSSGSITIADGANGQISIAPNGTGITLITGPTFGVITSSAGNSPLTVRHTATASGSTSNYGLNVQKHRTDIALGSMTNEPAVIAFSVRDSSNTNRIFGRLFASYAGTGTQPSWSFQTSVDGFTSTSTPLTFGAGTAVWGVGGSAYTHTTNGAGNLTLNTNAGTNSGSIVINQGANANISITPNGTGKIVLDGLSWPNADGTNGQVLSTDGAGTLSWTTASGGSSWQSALVSGATTFYTGTKYINWNSEDSDTNGLVTVGSNGTFTISSAGTYLIQWLTHHTMGDPNPWQLYNQTGSAVLKSFSVGATDGGFGGFSYIHTITASNIYRWQNPNTGATAINNTPQMLITKIA